MTKREKVYNKFNGLCSYCGCELNGKFHIDHIQPIVRNPRTKVPEQLNESIENLTPACPSCNIMKHSLSIEQFREQIKQFVQSLNKYNNQYKFAKKYGLVTENDIEVKFYFETLKDESKHN